MHTVKHALTVDLEDWFHVCGAGPCPQVPQESWRVAETGRRVLDLLDEFDIKATFFVLGVVAEAEPALIEQIAACGHEIASHGYSHRQLHELEPEEFNEELELTEGLVQRLTGKRPRGFRAPQWSLTSRTHWADDILVERGYCYDSSRNPLLFVGEMGLPRHPYQIAASQGTLWEIPPMVTETRTANLPTGGGWGFRFFPQQMIETTIDAYEQAGYPAVLYLHPRELDPQGPRLSLPALKRFVTYGTRSDAADRLRGLLARYSFHTLEEMVAAWQSAS